MTGFIPRSTRQHIEGEMWTEDAVDFLLELGVFSFSEVVQAREVAKKLLYFNKDEGGELMEVDARVFMKSWIRELLEE
ncbi:hypothetical protein D3C85_1277840 [compost metagenome]